MAEWFAKSNVYWFRQQAEDRLIEEKKLSPSRVKEETAAGFWMRMEKAGLLEEVLKLYDEIAESHAEWMHATRETKKMFAERIEREGRQEEVESERKRLSAEGHSLRKIHEELVDRFQPLDGSWTRPWTTPNPWENGRFFRKKEDKERLQAEIERGQESNYCPKNRWRYEWEQMHEEKRSASTNAKYRMDCAEWRREERVALANARRRAPEAARELKERQAATKAEAERLAAAKVEAERKAAEAKVEAERKAAEEKKQQEIREKEEAKKRKTEEQNARHQKLKDIRQQLELAAEKLSTIQQKTSDGHQIGASINGHYESLPVPVADNRKWEEF
jgi:hypothetical protein